MTRLFLIMCAMISMQTPAESPDDTGKVQVGLGYYRTQLAPGGEHEPPAANQLAAPVPTNRWYSSLAFNRWPQPLYAQPASYRPTEQGFEIDLPQRTAQIVESRAETDIIASHRAMLTVQATDFQPSGARIGKTGDWSLDVVMAADRDALTATIAHGSPYAYFTLSRGDAVLRAAQAIHTFALAEQGRALGVTIDGKPFGLFAPHGARWEPVDDKTLRLHLPQGKDCFTVAVLSAATPAQLALFAQHAFAFITDTRVDWAYDEAQATLTSTFHFSTVAKEGSETAPLFALYPHQWFDNPLAPTLLDGSYASIRGPLKLASGQRFQTRYRYNGILPSWPALDAAGARDKLAGFIAEDSRFGAAHLLGNRGTYWEGKGLNRAAQLMAIAEQQGNAALRDDLLNALKGRLQKWFAPAEEGGSYFYYNRDIGSLIGYPDEFGSAEEMNDHHFHYGYWIFSAAQVALRDPAWAAQEHWGGMVEALIGDIANTDPADRRFPRLRNFDSYEGHSWASGIVPFYDGNNQESSSEAINAWAGMILWGEATGNQRIRDAGIYLYTTEIAALQHYWFDLHGQVFDQAYRNIEAAMVWGNKYVHTTWWTEDPREVHGINLLPLTTASLYLGADPAFVRRNLAAMDQEFAAFIGRGGKAPDDIWQDILLGYAALDDAPAALAKWRADGAVESGETRSHTWYWMQSLAALGRPDFSVHADTSLYGVFTRRDGRRTWLAYNVGAAPREVRFSDGVTMTVAPRSLGMKSSVLSKARDTLTR